MTELTGKVIETWRTVRKESKMTISQIEDVAKKADYYGRKELEEEAIIEYALIPFRFAGSLLKKSVNYISSHSRKI